MTQPELFPSPVQHHGRVYVLRERPAGPLKVGFTTRSVQERVAELQTGNPNAIDVVAIFAAPIDFEKALHGMLDSHRVRSEWFELSEDVAIRIMAEARDSGIDAVFISPPWQRHWDEFWRRFRRMISAIPEEYAYQSSAFRLRNGQDARCLQELAAGVPIGHRVDSRPVASRLFCSGHEGDER